MHNTIIIPPLESYVAYENTLLPPNARQRVESGKTEPYNLSERLCANSGEMRLTPTNRLWEVCSVIQPNWSAFEQYVSETMEEHKIPGMAVGVSANGETIYEKGFGVRDRQTGESVDPDTVFGIASVSKSFTTMAIMQLVDQGKVSLYDPVTKHVPGFRIKTVHPMTKITVHHLMSHTAGLPPLPGLYYAMKQSMEGYPKWDESQQTPNPALAKKCVPPLERFDDYLAYLAAEEVEMLGQPGEYFSYSNDCYCALGALIEHVTGQNYYDYMQEHLFRPICMQRTTFSADAISGWPNVTSLYFSNKNREVCDVPRWQRLGAYDAGGGIKSSIRDLLKYLRVYVQDGFTPGSPVVSKEGIHAVRTPVYEIGRGIYYGYGLQVTPDYAGDCLVEHGGSLTGVASNVGYATKAKVAVAVLTNLSGAPAADIWLRAMNTALGLGPHMRRSIEPEFHATTEQLERLCGTYTSGEGTRATVFLEEGIPMFETQGEKFACRASDRCHLVFVQRGQQRVAKFYLDDSGQAWAMFYGLRMLRRNG